jgi:iron complex transport system substrate-binding protein
MPKLFLSFMLFLLAGAGNCATARAAGDPVIRFYDDRGKAFVLGQPAARIITLAPHLAELVFAAGAEKYLVGVAAYTDYPQQAGKLPVIGDSARVDAERVVELKPDLILAWRSGTPAGEVERLEKLGLRVVVTEPEKLSDIPRLLRLIGEMTDTGTQAAGQAARFEDVIEKLRKRYARSQPVKAFYEIWHYPLMTINGRHIISDAIRLCGGVNIFADMAALTPTLSMETLFLRNPDVILTSASPDAWLQHTHLAAVSRHQVYALPADIIQRPTPRIAQGIRLLCDALEHAHLYP